MLTFCFPNIDIGHIDSSTPLVTNSSIDVRGEWVPNCDDETLVLRLSIVFDRVEDGFEFYKRYAIHIGFSIRNSPTEKNKSGKYWKRYVCSKEGFCQPAKMPEINNITVEAMPQARDGPKGRKLKENRSR